jgi:hypothetical protein
MALLRFTFERGARGGVPVGTVTNPTIVLMQVNFGSKRWLIAPDHRFLSETTHRTEGSEDCDKSPDEVEG